jgi:hypothetical protein
MALRPPLVDVNGAEAGRWVGVAKIWLRHLEARCRKFDKKSLVRVMVPQEGVRITLTAYPDSPGTIKIKAGRGPVINGNLFSYADYAMAEVDGTAYGREGMFNAIVTMSDDSSLAVTPVNSTRMSAGTAVKIGNTVEGAPTFVDSRVVNSLLDSTLPTHIYDDLLQIGLRVVTNPDVGTTAVDAHIDRDPAGLTYNSRLRAQDPDDSSLSIVVETGDIRYGKWIADSTVGTSPVFRLLDYEWFVDSFDYLPVDAAASTTGVANVTYNVPNISGESFQMTLTAAEFVYNVGSASEDWIEHAYTTEAAGNEPTFVGELNTVDGVTTASGVIVFQAKLVPSSRYKVVDILDQLGVPIVNDDTSSLLGSVWTFTSRTFVAKQDGDIFYSEIVQLVDVFNPALLHTYALGSKKYSTITFDNDGDIVETPRIVAEKTITVSYNIPAGVFGSVSAYSLTRHDGHSGLNRNSAVSAMTYDGTPTFSGGVTTVGDVAEHLYRRDLAGTGPTPLNGGITLVHWDGKDFETIEHSGGDAVIYMNGSNLGIDPSLRMGHEVNTSGHGLDLRRFNAYSVGSGTEAIYSPTPGPISGTGSYLITYLDSELAVTTNVWSSQLGFPSNDGRYNVFKNMFVRLATDEVGLHDADTMHGGAFQYSDYAPLTVFDLVIFWPKAIGSRDGLCAVDRTADWDAKFDLWKAEVANPAATDASIAAARSTMLAEHTVVYNNFATEDLIISMDISGENTFIVVDHTT